jgi:hypothetical protein
LRYSHPTDSTYAEPTGRDTVSLHCLSTAQPHTYEYMYPPATVRRRRTTDRPTQPTSQPASQPLVWQRPVTATRRKKAPRQTELLRAPETPTLPETMLSGADSAQGRPRKFTIQSQFGRPRQPRSRKNRPCDACRKRKTACVITSEPPCKSHRPPTARASPLLLAVCAPLSIDLLPVDVESSRAAEPHA